MLKNKLLIFISFLYVGVSTFGCVRETSEDAWDIFEQTVYSYTSLSWYFEVFPDVELGLDKKLQGAPLTFRPLFKIQSIFGNTLKDEVVNYCLSYRFPYHAQSNAQGGSLAFYELSKDKKCNDLSKVLLAELDDVENLKIDFSQGYLKLVMWRSGRERVLQIPLYNAERGVDVRFGLGSGSSRKMERYASSGVETYFGKTFLLSFGKTARVLAETNAEISAFGVSKEEDSDEFSFLIKKQSNCQDDSQDCTQNKCGQNGQPACFRGKTFVKGVTCDENILAGFCEDGLDVVCSTEGYLFCQ